MSTKYTADEVAKHNVLEGPNKSTWVIFHGKIYDITNFVSEHPGGTEVLADTAGKDITRSFTEIGHSDHARGLMTPMLVGELVRRLENWNTKTVDVNRSFPAIPGFSRSLTMWSCDV